MTSDVNDAATRAFFKKNAYFGYDPDDVFFFQQGMMPAFAMDGRLLLGEQRLARPQPRRPRRVAPRAASAAARSTTCSKRGVEHLSYFQVDNPLVHTIDPLFLGLHDLTGSEMSSKTIPKADAAGEGRQLRRRRRRAAGDRVQRPARGAGQADQPRRHARGSTPARSRSTRCAVASSSG